MTTDYDEFALFHENLEEHDLTVPSLPEVRRQSVELADGRSVSALCWGVGEPQLVLLHGGAQNAHTWDTVALALGVPLVAIDLPGHGHSSWRDDGRYLPEVMAHDMATAVGQLAPGARAVVGMSLGGLTALALAGHAPHLVRRLGLVDITPGVNRTKAKAIIDFVNGPQQFPRFDDLLARTMEHHPTRSESSLRRGILHNARPLDDGSWVWRYDRRGHARSTDESEAPTIDGLSPLWGVLGATTCPVLLARGSVSPVVDDADVQELLRRRPDARVDVIEGAGHSIQGDRPVALGHAIRDWALDPQ